MQKDKITFEKVMKKAQKPLIISLFAIFIAFFVYSLMFMTPFYDIYIMNNTANFTIADMSIYGIDFSAYKAAYPNAVYTRCDKLGGTCTTEELVDAGLNMGYFTTFFRDNMQVFNKTLFAISFFGIVGSLILFVYHSQKRKRYYLTNFISIGLVIAFGLFASIFTLINIFNIFANISDNVVDYNIINAYQTANGNDYSSGKVVEYFNASNISWTLIVGIVLCIISIIILLAGIAFLINKYLYQKKHPALDVSGVVINE